MTIIPNDYRSGVPVLNTVTLRFKFNVDINIWPHDTIVLYVPEKWSIPSSLESCNSVDVSAHENYFKTVSLDENAEHQLQCTPSASDHAIYIYGISEEIDISEAGEEDDKLPMYLDISGLTAP